MDEHTQPPDLKDAAGESGLTTYERKLANKLRGVMEGIGLSETFTLSDDGLLGCAVVIPVLKGLSKDKLDSFKAGIQRLRDDLSWRRATMKLPAKSGRDADIDKLRKKVAAVKKAAATLQTAAAPFFDGPPGFLPKETHQWLLDADEVVKDLTTLAKPSSYKIFERGFARPNDHREWLFACKIPELFKEVFGRQISITPRAKTNRAKLGGEFFRLVLNGLGEKPAADETIKSLMFKAKNRVTTG